MFIEKLKNILGDRWDLIQLLTGLVGLGIFLLTGMYMKMHYELLISSDATHFQFRANHVYLLLTSLMNLSLWQNPVTWTHPVVNGVSKGGRLLVILSFWVLLFAFFTEPAAGVVRRPITVGGNIMALSGVLLHIVAKVSILFKK